MFFSADVFNSDRYHTDWFSLCNLGTQKCGIFLFVILLEVAKDLAVYSLQGGAPDQLNANMVEIKKMNDAMSQLMQENLLLKVTRRNPKAAPANPYLQNA
jgi:hypothetical protein